VRNLDQETRDALRQQAARNGRSTEAEVRWILAEAVRERGWVCSWLDNAAKLRGEDLPLPKRSKSRELSPFEDLS
jgi:plasmid stability protein